MNNFHPTRSHQKRQTTTVAEGIEQHRDYLFNYALGWLRKRELAEDAVHDSFLAALTGADKFLRKSSERTWLTGILKHKVCDQVRRARRDLAVFELGAPTERNEFDSFAGQLSAAMSADPSAELERKELRHAIHEALSELPQRVAKAFSLYESEGWTGREICAELGISESNLWVILHRARRQLREQLSPWQTVTC
jgi:RNA polymerase sigma-70 factor, ECF subfamily